MLLIKSESTNPYFNLALEELLLMNLNEECFLVYTNEPSVIVGKHQNAIAEINYNFVIENKIKVARRLSGGGTVYHDLGNVNFTFIKNVESEHLVDFKKHIAPIVKVLQNLKIDARLDLKNSITANGYKISGNAEHVYKNRVLHHGTLLFETDLEYLSQALKTNPFNYSDKAVKSIRSKVTNIKGLLNETLTIEKFINKIYDHILKSSTDAIEYKLTEEDIMTVKKLISEKYSIWDWNYGYSPRYLFKKILKMPKGLMEINMEVEKGIIQNLILSSDSINYSILRSIENAFQGIRHDKSALTNRLNNSKLGKWVFIVDGFF